MIKNVLKEDDRNSNCQVNCNLGEKAEDRKIVLTSSCEGTACALAHDHAAHGHDHAAHGSEDEEKLNLILLFVSIAAFSSGLVAKYASSFVSQPNSLGVLYGYPFIIVLQISILVISLSIFTLYEKFSVAPSNSKFRQYTGCSTPSFVYASGIQVKSIPSLIKRLLYRGFP